MQATNIVALNDNSLLAFLLIAYEHDCQIEIK